MLGAARFAFMGQRRQSGIAPPTATIGLVAPDPTIQGSNILAALTPAEIRLLALDPSLGLPTALTPDTADLVVTSPNPTVRLDSLCPDAARINLTAPNPTITTAGAAWPNGYVAYRDIVIPAGALAAALTNLVMLFDETVQGLRTIANGGRVNSSSGWDIRFESVTGVAATTGTKLDHELAGYDPASGRPQAFLRLPSAGTGRIFLRVYYGKPGLSATEENPAGLWTGTKLVLDCRTGVDRSGNGFALTMSSVGAGALIGDAGDYGGSSVANRADAAALAGLTALTLRCLIQPDAAMVGATKGWLCLNTPTGSDSTAALALQYLAASATGVEDVIHAKIRTTTGNAYVVSTTGKHAAQRQLLHAVFQDGQAPKLYLDGADVSGDTAVQSGGLTLGTGGLYLGLGPRDPVTGAWQGLLDELALIASAHTPARVAAEAKSWNTPRRFYAIGGENLAGDTNLAPIAPPMEASGTIGVDQDIDVAANGIAPGGGALSITGTPTANNGTVSVASGKLRFRPATALATISYLLLGAGGKTCQGHVWVSAALPITTFPRVPTGPFTATLRVPSEYPTIAAALAAAAPGNRILVANGTYREEIDSSKSGSSAGGYIVIMAENHLGATLAGTTAGGVRSWKFTGSYIWVTGFVCNNPQEHSPNYYQGGKNSYYNSDRPEYQFRLAGSNLRVTNCRINSPCGIGIANACNGIDICYNEFTMNLPIRWSQANAIYMGHSPSNSAGANNVLIARNKWTGDADVTHWTSDPNDPSVQGNDNDGRYCFYSGNNEPEDNNTGNNRSVRFIENFVNMVNTPTGYYCKRGYEHRRNFIRAKFTAFNQRHGGYSKADGTVFAGLDDSKRCLIVGCNFDKGIFRLNDTDHLVVSNRFGGNAELYYGARRTQGTSATSYNINPSAGWLQAASRVIFVGCTFVGQLRAGEDESAGPNKFKVWGAAEQTQWGAGEPNQGGTIKGVRNYPAGVTSPAQPTDGNGRFVRIRNLYDEKTIEDGNAGYQVFADNDNGGFGTYVQAYVTRAELENATGCNAA